MQNNPQKVNIFDLEEEDFDTVLATDIDFSGDVELKKPLMIKGVFTGSINSESALSIEEGAIVKANVKADSLVVKGALEGDVVAETVVRIYPSGKLSGDVTAPEVILDSGCYFTGNCKMTKELKSE
ncbi:MAG: bactofilin family protein [Treponema sp.]